MCLDVLGRGKEGWVGTLGQGKEGWVGMLGRGKEGWVGTLDQGKEHDMAKAVEYYRMAAELGHAGAQACV